MLSFLEKVHECLNYFSWTYRYNWSPLFFY